MKRLAVFCYRIIRVLQPSRPFPVIPSAIKASFARYLNSLCHYLSSVSRAQLSFLRRRRREEEKDPNKTTAK
jgi:hypothetical protein